MAIQTVSGSCHCGAVRFEADIDLTQPTYRCNCSVCRRNRFWPAIVMPDRFRLLAGADALGFVLYEKSPRHVTLEQAADRLQTHHPTDVLRLDPAERAVVRAALVRL